MAGLDFSGRRVLVTGHSGFKGAWLSYILSSLGADVLGFSLAPPDDRNHAYFELGIPDLVSNRSSCWGDIREIDSIRRVLRENGPADDVFHLAGQAIVSEAFFRPLETFETNIMGHLNLLRLFDEEKQFPVTVLVTSDKVYLNDESGRPYAENDVIGGTEPYSGSKAAAEIAIAAWLQSFPEVARAGIGIARAGNVFGWGDTSINRLVPDLIRARLQNRKIVLRNPGSVRPWTHVTDILRGYLMLSVALRQGVVESANAWNFSSGETLTVRQVAQILGGSRTDLYLENVSSEQAFRESNLLQLSPLKAQTELGWRPRTNLAKRLEELSRWVEMRSREDDLGPICADLVTREFA